MSAPLLEMLHATTEISQRDPIQLTRGIFDAWIRLALDGDGHDPDAPSLRLLQNEEREPSATRNESDGLLSHVSKLDKIWRERWPSGISRQSVPIRLFAGD